MSIKALNVVCVCEFKSIKFLTVIGAISNVTSRMSFGTFDIISNSCFD